MMSKVSIVVPIYKVEDYIRKCIDSIISQTYKNLEIILINDGSPDSSPQICDEYALRDSRVRVVHKENGGLSDARNAGIRIATGEYIAFVDSDDYIANNYVELLLQAARDNNADISCCNYYFAHSDGRLVSRKSYDNRSFSSLEAIRDIFTPTHTCDVVTWNKLYKTKLFTDDNIWFPKGRIHEDNFTTYRLFYYANKITYIDNPLYFYLRRDDSIMGQTFSLQRLTVLDMLTEAKEFFKNHHINMEDELQYRNLLTVLGLHNDYLSSTTRDDKIDSTLTQALNGIGDINGNKLISKKHRLMLNLVKISPWFYVKLRLLYERGKM